MKVHLFNGEATNFKQECQEFEEQIAKVGGIEFMFLGEFCRFCCGCGRPTVVYNQVRAVMGILQGMSRVAPSRVAVASRLWLTTPLRSLSLCFVAPGMMITLQVNSGN